VVSAPEQALSRLTRCGSRIRPRQSRRRTVQPASDTMSVLSGFLRAEQGVACFKSLRDGTDAVKAAGDRPAELSCGFAFELNAHDWSFR
jgi:hypothetical protein